MGVGVGCWNALFRYSFCPFRPSSQRNTQEIITKLQRQLAAERDHVSSLRMQIEHLQKENLELDKQSSRVRDLEAQIQRVEGKNKQLLKEQQDYKRSGEKEKAKKLRTQVHQLTAANQRMQQEISEWKDLLADAREELRVAQDEAAASMQMAMAGGGGETLDMPPGQFAGEEGAAPLAPGMLDLGGGAAGESLFGELQHAVADGQVPEMIEVVLAANCLFIDVISFHFIHSFTCS